MRDAAPGPVHPCPLLRDWAYFNHAEPDHWATDVGAMTPLLWGFEEREELMRFTSASGAPAWLFRRRSSGPARRSD